MRKDAAMRRIRPAFARLASLAALAALFCCTPVAGGDFLDLVVPVYRVDDASMEGALDRLREWGVTIGFEKLPEEAERHISITRYGAPLREILDAIASAENGYRWQSYRTRVSPGCDRVLVNVMPLNALEDGQNLMNLGASRFEWPNVHPALDLARLHEAG